MPTTNLEVARHAGRLPSAAFQVLLLSLLIGCAGPFSLFRASRGPAWTELSSEHFCLRTDVAVEEARATLGDLEQLRAALLTCFGARADARTGRVQVIAIEDGWSDFAGPRVTGFFSHAWVQPLIVLQAQGHLERQEIIKHELVHFLTEKVIPVQPRWFAEGMATYFQTVEYDVAKRQ